MYLKIRELIVLIHAIVDIETINLAEHVFENGQTVLSEQFQQALVAFDIVVINQLFSFSWLSIFTNIFFPSKHVSYVGLAEVEWVSN